MRAAVSDLLLRDFAELKLGFVTVTDVEISTDLKVARIYVSVFGDQAKQQEAISRLQGVRPKFRHLLAQRSSLRRMPELEFHLDRTAEQAISIEKKLRELGVKSESPEEGDENAEDRNDS